MQLYFIPASQKKCSSSHSALKYVNYQLSNQSSTSYAINQRSVLVSIVTRHHLSDQQSANHSGESDQLPALLLLEILLP
jgi:hypothetical protein